MSWTMAAGELPIDRWSGTSGEVLNWSTLNPIRIIANLMMAIATWLWQLIKQLFAFAYLDFVSPMVEFIDAGFEAVYQSLVSDSPIFGFVLVAGVAVIGIALFRRGIGGGLFQQIVLFALPIAALLWLGSAVVGSGEGVPSKIAKMGVEFSNGLGPANDAIEGANEALRDAVNESPSEGMAFANTPPMSCASYVTALYQQTDAPQHRQFASRLWETGYLPSFYMAGFGDPDTGRLLGCRLLEPGAGVSAQQQALIQGGGIDPSYFVQYADSSETRQAKLLMWAICHTRANGEQWIILQVEDCSFKEPLFRDEERNAFQTAWDLLAWSFNPLMRITNDDPNPHTRHNVQVIEDLTVQLEDAYSEAMATHPDQAAQINAEIATYNAIVDGGGGTGQAVLGGMMALVSAAAVLFSFGALAVGAGMAGIMMVVLMMVLPITLLALAVNKSRHVGARLLSLTFASLFAKMVFTLAITVTIALTGRSQAVLIDLMDPGLGRSMVLMAVPVVVIFMLRKLAKIAGFGKLATLSGAMKATASVDAAMTQNAQAGGFAGTANPFSRFRNPRSGRTGGSRGEAETGRLTNLAQSAAHRVTREGRAHASHSRDVRRRTLINEETVRNRVVESRARTEERAKESTQSAVAQRKALASKHGERAANQYLYRDGAKPIPRPGVSTSTGEGGRAFNTEDPFHAINALPAHLTARRVDTGGNQETEEQWHTRLDSYLTALGMRDTDGNDTYSLAGSLTPKERQRVLEGDTKPLEKLATQRLSPTAIHEAEVAAAVEDRFLTSAHTSWKQRTSERLAAGAVRVDPRRITDGLRPKASKTYRREELIDRRTRERAAAFIAEKAPEREQVHAAAKAQRQQRGEAIADQVRERRRRPNAPRVGQVTTQPSDQPEV